MACSANINDINNALSSEIFSTIQNDSELSMKMEQVINDFVNNSNDILAGNMWDVEKRKLQKYMELLVRQSKVETQLYNDLKEALLLIKNYLGQYEELDLKNLDELKITVKDIESKIANLRKMMKETKIVNVYEKETLIKSYETSLYDNDYLRKEISNAQELLEKTKRLIDKIEGLEDVMNRAQVILNQTYSQIEKYNNDVESIDNNGNIWATGAVGLVNFAGGVGKVAENVVDGILWTGGGLIFTIGDWVGADTAKGRQDLARAIGTDVVGGVVSVFFEETEFGRDLNNNSYYSYDSQQMQGVHNLANGATTFVAETLLPTPVAVAFGSFHNVGAKAEELYANDTNSLGGLGGDYGWRITASGVEGGINGYLSNNAVKEIKGFVNHGFGYYNEVGGITRPYSGMKDFVDSNLGDILGETTIDAISNISGTFSDNGNLSARDVIAGAGQAVSEQFIALGPRSPNMAQISSPIIDVIQGTGIDDATLDWLNANNERR